MVCFFYIVLYFNTVICEYVKALVIARISILLLNQKTGSIVLFSIITFSTLDKQM